MSESTFARSIAVLSGGTALAQGLGLLALPILTRLYRPADFGVLGVFSAVLGILSVVSALRYEIAIPLPEDDDQALDLLLIGLISVSTFCVTIALVIAISGDFIARLVHLDKTFLWILPFAVFATTTYSLTQYWATRKKAYHSLARTRVVQAACGIGAQLTTGWLAFGSIGLVIGQVISSGSGVLELARRAFQENRSRLSGVRIARLWATAREYHRFPKYSALEALANSGGVQIPLLLIAFLAGDHELGLVVLVMRILQAPMSLIGSSVAQVYYSQAIEAHRQHELESLTRSTLRKLAYIGFPPLVLVACASPAVPILFGQSWAHAGELLAWMAPFFFLQFLSSPLSPALHVIGQQRWALVLQVFGVGLRSLSVIMVSYSPSRVFAISSAVFYLIYLVLILHLIRKEAASSRHA